MRLQFKHVLLVFMLALFSSDVYCQVTPMPFVKSQFFNNTGAPLAGGRLYSYAAGTTIPLATYTDSTGLIANTDPIILDSAGRANIWLGASSYKFVLQNSLGVQIWSVDNVTSSNITLLGLNNIWTGTNTWNSTATFNAGAVFNAGLTSTGPNLLSGGGSFAGTWSGSPVFSGTPSFSNGFSSTVAGGTPPFTVVSTTAVPNLNASLLLGCTWAAPCPIGTTTPNTAVFSTLTGTTFILGGGIPLTGVTGTDVKIPSAGTMTGSAGTLVCLDSNGGVSTVGSGGGCTAAVVQQSTITQASANVAVAVNTLTNVFSKVVTMPAAGCPCRVFVSYGLFLSTANSGISNALVTDGTAQMATSQILTTGAASAYGTSASSFSPNTYANSAVVTFTTQIQATNAAGITVLQLPQNVGQNSWMNVAVFTSN